MNTVKRGSLTKYLIGSMVFSLIFIVIVASHASTTAETSKSTTTEEELYQKCKSAYTAKDIDSTNKYIKDFLSQYPQSKYIAEVSYIQASLQSDVNNVIGMYKEIISKYPNSKWVGKANFQLGQCYYLLEKYNEAAECYREVVVRFADDESYWQARYWRCKSLLAKGDCDGAIYALNSIRDSGNKEIGSDAILLSLGECYLAKKDYEKAESIIRSLTDNMLDSKWLPSAYLLLANSLQNLGKSEEAKASYQKVIENYPQSLEANQAKKQLGFPDLIKQDQPKAEKKVSPQLESLFLKASKDQQPSRTQAQTDSPSFKVEWKNDNETKSVTAKPKEGPKKDTKISIAKSESYFSVQVGAFSKKTSAEAMTKQLKKKYDVEIVSPAPGKKSLYKVWVGKFKTRDEAMKTAQKLSREEKLDNTIIVSSE